MDIEVLFGKSKKISLAFLPTPLEYAENLTKLLKGPKYFLKEMTVQGLHLEEIKQENLNILWLMF